MNLTNASWWIFLNVMSMVILAFYSMQEMACMSLNKIRLHYYVSKGMKRAIWLSYMLQNPARLFGTTLFCVNAAMMAGSEFSRETYEALGLDPNYAPLTQVLLVVIFAELAPMFAARRYAEHVALLGAPILYATAKVLTPLLWTLGWISKVSNFLIGGREAQSNVILNREDVQKIFEEQDERQSENIGTDFNTVTWNIFSLRHKDARNVMQPISTIPKISSTATVGQLRPLLEQNKLDYVPIYHRDTNHIIGIAIPRDLIRIPDSKRIRDHAAPPWFVSQHTPVMQILKEFRSNNNSIAIILNEHGLAIGVITLGDLVEEIFGEFIEHPEQERPDQGLIIDRTFPGDTKVADFNAQFDVELHENGDLTLAELMTEVTGHQPEVGESVYLAPFELTVKEASLMEIKKITITTII